VNLAKEEIEKLIVMLESNDPENRKSGSRKIWTEWEQISDKALIFEKEKLLLSLLKVDKGRRNVWYYMMILGLIESKRGQKALVEIIQESRDENLRGFAAEALGNYKLLNIESDSVELLMKLAKNDDALVVRVNSIRSLSKLYDNTKNDRISRHLLQLLFNESHLVVRTVILHGIGDIGSTATVPELIHLMITRRLELDINIARQTLDKIASSNSFNSRTDLIRKFSEKDLEINL
jgi:HEAT repeat protein